MDSYYKQRLGIHDFYSQKDRDVEKIDLEMKKIKFLGPFLASLNHPNDGVKTGAWLGMLSVFLATVSIIIAFVSYFTNGQ